LSGTLEAAGKNHLDLSKDCWQHTVRMAAAVPAQVLATFQVRSMLQSWEVV